MLFSDCANQALTFPKSHFFSVHVAPILNSQGDALSAFPFHADYTWSVLSELSLTLQVKGSIATLTPLLWQLDNVAHRVARAAGVPSISLQPENMKPIIPIANEVGVDIVVCARDAVPEVESLAKKCNIPPKALLAVHPLHEDFSYHPVSSTFFATVWNCIDFAPGFSLACDFGQPDKLLPFGATWRSDDMTPYISNEHLTAMFSTEEIVVPSTATIMESGHILFS